MQKILKQAEPPLHDYAQPNHFVTVPKIARTISGIVDYAWLASLAPACVYVAPRSDAETRVQRVFADILELPPGVLSKNEGEKVTKKETRDEHASALPSHLETSLMWQGRYWCLGLCVRGSRKVMSCLWDVSDCPA